MQLQFDYFCLRKPAAWKAIKLPTAAGSAATVEGRGTLDVLRQHPVSHRAVLLAV